MAHRLIILLIAALPLYAAAQDRDTLLKRERQFTQTLEATAARLLEEDDALKTLNRRIKAEQHQLYRTLQAHPKVKAIAPLQEANPVVYQKKYRPLRRELLETDKELQNLHTNILRLQAELARRLARRPEITVIRQRLEAVRRELAPPRK